MFIRMNPARDLSRATIYLLLTAIGLAVLHHIDHALRVDHSGWPFRDRITPFTFSLAAYPVILFALIGPAQTFWLRWGLLAAATAFTIYAHTAIESPYTQFHMWAHNQSANDAGLHNAFNVQSTILGLISAAVGMALNLTAVVATFFMLKDGMNVDNEFANEIGCPASKRCAHRAPAKSRVSAHPGDNP